VLDSVASRRTPLAGHLSGRRQCCRFWCDPLCYRVYVPWTTRPMLVKRLKARLSRRRRRDCHGRRTCRRDLFHRCSRSQPARLMVYPWSDGHPGNRSQMLHNCRRTDLNHYRLLARSFGQRCVESCVLNLERWRIPFQPRHRWWSSFAVSNVSLRTRRLWQRVNTMIARVFGWHHLADLQLPTWPLSALAIDHAIEVAPDTSGAEPGESVTRRPHQQRHPPLHPPMQESLDRAPILQKVMRTKLPMPQLL
jgi:hypothetical protein